MRNCLVAVLLLSLSGNAFASQVDPADALDEARRLIALKKYDEAARILTPALDNAAAIADEGMRRKALAALHFYTALAWSGAGDQKKAKAHLGEFFAAAPNSRSIDRKKYDASFVALFEQMAPADGGTFAQYYPSFSTFQQEPVPPPEPGTFGNTPAMLLLATAAERQEWSSLMALPDRVRFVEDFWKKRDPTPDTEDNAFRRTFERRLAYAEKVFAGEADRGSMSDRGRVFLLLGEPALVRRRSITSRDSREQVWLAHRATMLSGTIEYWIYRSDQLPVHIGQKQIPYRFVNQIGIGEYVLQQENAVAMQVLATAGHPRSGKK